MLPSLIVPVTVTSSLVPGLQIALCAIDLAPLPVMSSTVTLPSLSYCTNAGPHFLVFLQVHFEHAICPVRVFSPASATEALNARANANVIIYFIAMILF